jgi:hypothetical protein
MSFASARASQAKKPKTPKPPKPKRTSPPKKPGEKRPTGRPSSYTEEMIEKLQEELCMRIAKRESVNAILADPHMPSWPTIYSWREKYPEFAAKLARAREMRGEARVARVDDITDDVLAGRIDPNVGRVAIQAEQWAAGRESKAYSDRIQADVSATGGTLTAANELEVARRLLFLMAQAKRSADIEDAEVIAIEGPSGDGNT